MNEFIQKNKKLLDLYQNFVRIAGWIIKNGSTVLYAAAFIILMSFFINYLFFSFVSYSIETVKFSNIITFFIPAATKILIMIGLGKMLTRILLVIEEPKTLV